MGTIRCYPRGAEWALPDAKTLRQPNSSHLFFPIALMKMFGNGRAEKCVPLVDFSNRRTQVASGSLLDEIAHCTGVYRLDNIRFITVRRKHQHFTVGDGF